jgi:DNA-binding MurR/RpiR family transcriptional regulator
LNDPAAAQRLTITALASEAHVAESTVSRFVRELGLSGYKALTLGLSEAVFVSQAAQRAEAEVPSPLVYEGVARDDDALAIVGKVERSSIQGLRLTAAHQDPIVLGKAVDLIDAARTIVFICMGASSIAAEEAVMRFTRAGRKCLLFRDQVVQVMLASIVDEHDLVIAVSDSGQSTSIIQGLELAQSRGAKTIAITSNEDSPLVEHATVSLYTSNVPSGGELYGEAVTSKWGQILVIDILYAVFAARHYDTTIQNLERTYRNGIKQSRTR